MFSSYFYIFFGVTFWTEFTFSFNCTLYFYLKRWISDATSSLSGSSAIAEQLQSIYLSHYTQNYVTENCKEDSLEKWNAYLDFLCHRVYTRSKYMFYLEKAKENLTFFSFSFCVAQTVELSKQLNAFLKIHAGFWSFHSEVWNVFWIQDDLI